MLYQTGKEVLSYTCQLSVLGETFPSTETSLKRSERGYSAYCQQQEKNFCFFITILSPTKCSVLHVAPSNVNNITCYNFVYHIGNVALPTLNSVTDLGITCNNKLSFSTHIDNIVSKAALRANLIISCFRSRNPDLLMRAFCAFVRPTIKVLFCYLEPCFSIKLTKLNGYRDSSPND